MSPQEILDLEVSLLLIKYGKESLFKTIAKRLEIDEAILNNELQILLNSKSFSKNKKRNPPKPFAIDSVIKGKEEKSNYLRQLFSRFENKTFLPELKDVKRFFDRYEMSAPKSRLLAKAHLFKFLAELEISELEKLLDQKTTSIRESSALGLISDEILRRKKD